jgi:hypothetical protein
MTDVLLIVLGLLFIIQLIFFSKLVSLVKRLNKFLFEIRIYFKNSGIFYNSHEHSIIRSNTCQYCNHRMSYINISQDIATENFYYKCRLQSIDILLSDSCSQFERDYSHK